MSHPLFSIIIPTYQSEPAIYTCVKSVLDQTYEDFEIILQDGQSSDRTVEIIRSFKDDRIKIVSEKDKGVYDAMNRAIERTSGDWIYFLGSDDSLFERATLASLRDIVGKTEADLVYGNVMMSGDSHWINDGTIYRGETDLASLFEQNISHQSIVYRRRIFTDGHRFNLAYPVCADHDFNLFCFASYKVEYTPLIVAMFATGGLSTHIVDECFEREKWGNIITYYKGKLKHPSLLRHKGSIKRTGKILVKKGRYWLGLNALKTYVYFKFIKIRSLVSKQSIWGEPLKEV
ncbi:glycosyltransferase family 2 protein [Parapedobacter tibetensis]|uniref:glycosyltransferase family 2 protein n=1 Tax=Parapedobacter tibetensis TaxID=2972951 RepID=UPI00214DB114|nr:glycosyltransferase family 2 protein [Parapedobacter tibetensis]